MIARVFLRLRQIDVLDLSFNCLFEVFFFFFPIGRC